jgi:omega-amidase
MSDLKVALVQANQVWEDKEANLRYFEKAFSNLEVGVKLVLLPEMFQTGFTMNTDCAEEWHSSSSVEWLKNKSSENEMAIYTSLLIKEGNKTYNRGVFVFPNGELVKYDKRKCFGLAGEDKYIEAGQERMIAVYMDWRINLNICYDLRFPEVMRNFISSSNHQPDYDVNVIVANWPDKRIGHWQALIPARAIENQCYLLAVNRIGMDQNGLSYNGSSMAVSASGDYLFESSSEEGIYYALLKKNELVDFREKLPFLKDQTEIL